MIKLLLFPCLFLQLATVSNGLLPEKVPIGWLYLPAVGGANMSAYAPFSLAMKQLHIDQVLPKNVELDIRWYYFECDAYNGSIGFIDLVKLHNVTGLIGPPCSKTGDVIGRLAVSWNILLISQKIESSMFTDKTLYKTLARTVLTSTSEMANAVISFLEEFQWHTIGIIHKRLYETDLLYDALMLEFRNHAINVNVDVKYKEDATADDIDSYLATLRKGARIIIPVLSWSFDGSEELLLRAHKNNMTGADYSWILCRLEVPVDGLNPWEEVQSNSEEVKSAYSNVMTIYPSAYDPTKLRPFRERIRTEYHELYPQRDIRDYEFTQLQAALYDSLYAYGYVLNLSVTAGVAHDDGVGLFELMKLKKIPGATAPIIFDNYVERAPTYSVMGFDDERNWTHSMVIDRKLNLLTKQYDYVIVYQRDPHWGTADNQPPRAIPACGFDGALCVTVDNSYIYISIVACIVGVLLLFILGYLLQQRRLENELMNMNWQIDHTKLIEDTKRASSRHTNDSGSVGSGSLTDPNRSTASHLNYHDRLITGKYEGQHCHIFKYETAREVRLSREQLKLLKALKNMNHENLGLFIGMSVVSRDELLILWGCSSRRTLRDIIESTDMALDDDFLATFLRGAVSGLRYIHHTVIGVHGNLNSETCVVDSRLVLKISDYAMAPLLSPMAKEGIIKIDREPYELYHCAPELMVEMTKGGNAGTKPGDIFSLGMIFFQIIAKKPLYWGYNGTEEALMARIQDTRKLPMRPTFPEDISLTWLGMLSLIKECWGHEPAARPTVEMIYSAVSVATSQFSGNIIEKMIKRMERYTTDLEKVVGERTAEVHAQQERAERLLRQMLPKTVADRLQAGITVTPETFDAATILFTDIVHFTDMSAKHTAIEIVSLLNELYSNFDDLIDKHDVYKVETIGDSYMVVSGLPHRTEKHADEITSLSLALRDYVRGFIMPFMDEEPLRIRLGAHTGSVATGVVGIKMPRYCLFGDTVNTASRMESNGIPMRLHVTEQMKKQLEGSINFEVVLRGEIEIKGKGTQTTYFVERKGHGANH